MRTNPVKTLSIENVFESDKLFRQYASRNHFIKINQAKLYQDDLKNSIIGMGPLKPEDSPYNQDN